MRQAGKRGTVGVPGDREPSIRFPTAVGRCLRVALHAGQGSTVPAFWAGGSRATTEAETRYARTAATFGAAATGGFPSGHNVPDRAVNECPGRARRCF